MKHICLAICLGTFALALAVSTACSSDNGTTLTETDSGSAIVIQTGDEVTVRLVSNPSTGYQWVIINAYPLVQVGDSIYEEADTDDVVGASGTEIFTFDTPTTGSGTVLLEYRRSWETSVPADATWSIDVTVE